MKKPRTFERKVDEDLLKSIQSVKLQLSIECIEREFNKANIVSPQWEQVKRQISEIDNRNQNPEDNG